MANTKIQIAKKINLFILIICLGVELAQAQTFTGKLGYGVSPLGHTGDFSQFVPFLEEVANTCNGGIVFGNGEWRNSPAESGNIPNLQKTVTLLQPQSYNYTDMVNFAWRSGEQLHLSVPGDTTNNWTNTTMKNLFLNMLIDAADSLEPTYMFIGNETSRYWEIDSIDYMNWVDFYEQAYDSIKARNPAIKVGTVFNYEHLAGLGELTGFTNAYWGAFNAHDSSKIDVLGLTIYPFFHDTLATDIPLTYLDPVFSRWGNKPVSITETGWPSDSFIGTWESSPLQQVNYVDRLFKIIDGHNVESVNWLFLHYLTDNTGSDAEKIFKSVSMRDSLGNDQPALAKWLSMCTTTKIGEHDVTENELVVFPNPSSGNLNIQLNRKMFGNGNLSITDIDGRLIFERRLKEDEDVINVALYKQGVFFIALDNGIYRATKKIIIHKNNDLPTQATALQRP